MNKNKEARFNDENINHLEPSSLKISGAHGKPVKIYRYVGSTSDNDWNEVKEYFFYVTPEYVLRNGVTGFGDYSDIGWYCKHKDLFIIEQKLNVPLHLTIGYRERLRRTEAGEWYNIMKKKNQAYVDTIAQIKGWFTEAVYPESVRDYFGDIVSSSRVYLPDRKNFFDEGGVCFIIREEQDFIAMFVNLEYSKNLGNCMGFLDGIFCYLDFDPELADLINDYCYDETEEFRFMFVEGRNHYVYKNEPSPYRKKEHEFHSGCTLKDEKHCEHPCRRLYH